MKPGPPCNRVLVAQDADTLTFEVTDADGNVLATEVEPVGTVASAEDRIAALEAENAALKAAIAKAATFAALKTEVAKLPGEEVARLR